MKARALVAWNVRRIRVNRGIPLELLAYDAKINRSYMGGIEQQSENLPRPTHCGARLNLRVPADRDHRFQAIVITHSRAS